MLYCVAFKHDQTQMVGSSATARWGSLSALVYCQQRTLQAAYSLLLNKLEQSFGGIANMAFWAILDVPVY